MEETAAAKGQQQVVVPSAASAGKSKLRYQLRSGIKVKEENPSPKEAPLPPSATRRTRAAPNLSKSMNVLDLSSKEKSAKPPRRLSIPAKTSGTPTARRLDSMTPISESRATRAAITQPKSDTPSSEVSKSGMRKQYNRLTTSSYWLSQIKLAETAAMHSISLGFFKLALDAGCEPRQQMRNEVKAYARKFNLGAEHEELVKELFDSYNITEDPEESENTSEVIQGGTKSSDEDVQCAASSMGTRNLKPKSLNSDVARASAVEGRINKEPVQKKSLTDRTTRGSVNRSSVVAKSASITATKTSEKTIKPKTVPGKVKVNKREEKTVDAKGNPGLKEAPEENKENMGDLLVDVEQHDTVEVM